MRHHTHNLPATLAPPVGREEELARLLGLPDSSSRLATIVGAGGVGKTRLAPEGARAMQSRYRWRLGGFL
ncbi:MAG: ATP-binding protein [Thermomicrobiales bacterium]|nr:ATP-binding protein [Thermomicrobiales bacterium]